MYINFSNCTLIHSNCAFICSGVDCFVRVFVKLLGECIALWGEPNELSIQHHVYIFMQYVDS